MASRFLFQKFSDGMSRSTSLLRTHRTLGNVFYGPAVHHRGMTVPSNRGIHGYATKYFKQIFSSSASKQAQDAARKPKISLETQVNATIAMMPFCSIGWLFILSNVDNDADSNKGSRCNCQCSCANVKQD